MNEGETACAIDVMMIVIWMIERVSTYLFVNMMHLGGFLLVSKSVQQHST